jgi:hypothetical protein
MGYSLLDAATATRQQAMAGMETSSKLEQQREAENKQLKAAKKQQTMSAVGTGAGIGFMVGGPVGAGVGAGVGLVASLF